MMTLTEREEYDRLIPHQAMMEIAVVVLKNGPGFRCFLVWSEADLADFDAGDQMEDFFGGFPPERHERRPLELGGDYPQIFFKLAKFLRTKRVPMHWPEPGMFITLRPTEPDEACGMLGGRLANGQFRLCLYFDKQSGLELALEFAGDNSNAFAEMNDYFSSIVACSLPETGGAPIIEFDHGTSWFLCWLFRMHLYQANQLP